MYPSLDGVIRMAWSAVLLLAALFMPLWVAALCALLGVFFYTGYWEIIAVFFIYDLLYYGGTFYLETEAAIIAPLTLYAFLAFVGSGMFRQLIRERQS